MTTKCYHCGNQGKATGAYMDQCLEYWCTKDSSVWVDCKCGFNGGKIDNS